MDPIAVEQPQQATRASGDVAAVGSRTLVTSELLCESVDLRAGERVLDVACGSGNAALAAARRFPSAEHQVEFLAAFYGPAVMALQALGLDRAAALKTEMLDLAWRFDVSDDDTLVLRLDYLEVVVRKPVWL